MHQHRRRRPKCDRQGNALVELVLSIPILILLTFGSIEACNLNNLQQNAVQVAYQGALSGMSAASNEANIEARMDDMYAAYNLTGCTSEVSGMNGEPYDSLSSGDRFLVRSNIPAQENMPTLSVLVSIADVECVRIAVKP